MAPNLEATVWGFDTERRGEGSLSAQPGSSGTDVHGAVEVAAEKRMVQAETGCTAALQKHAAGACNEWKRGRGGLWQLWQLMHEHHANSSAWLWWIPKSWPDVPLASVYDSPNKDIIKIHWNLWGETRGVCQRAREQGQSKRAVERHL